MKNFALTGIAGYIAIRHLQAIKDTGNNLVASLDPHDSVGVLDRFFPESSYFTEFERFDRHLEKLRREKSPEKVDFITICSPNHLHDAHIRLAFRVGADAICEKPLVLNPWNLDQLEEIEKETGNTVFNVLQLRVHPAILKLKNELTLKPTSKKYDVVLTYITSRGPWYRYSWKGREEVSGGIATNIGIHFFDMIIWLFGGIQKNIVHLREPNKASGYLELENANVRWFLSIDSRDLPKEAIQKNKTTFRSITINDKEIEFTDGFTDLHSQIYKKILAGEGFLIEDARPSIELVYQIRNHSISPQSGSFHPFLLSENYINQKAK